MIVPDTRVNELAELIARAQQILITYKAKAEKAASRPNNPTKEPDKRLLRLKKGGRLWTKEEDDFLLFSRRTLSWKEICSKLGRSYCSVKGRLGRLADQRPAEYKAGKNVWRQPYTDADNKFISENYSKLTTDQLATALSRTKSSITSQLHRLRHPRRSTNKKVSKK